MKTDIPPTDPFARAYLDIRFTTPHIPPANAIAAAALEPYGIITELPPAGHHSPAFVTIFTQHDDWKDFTQRWVEYRNHIGLPISEPALALAMCRASTDDTPYAEFLQLAICLLTPTPTNGHAETNVLQFSN